MVKGKGCDNLETLIVIGVLFILTWLFLYFRYFKEGKEENVRAGSTAYFVASWGDDNNNGFITSPWKTLQHAVNQLQPGEKLLIRAGVYKENVSLKKSGTGENPIIIDVFQGEEAVLDGGGAGWKYGFNFEHGVSFVTLSGLKVKNFEGYGVALWGENQSIQLKNLEAQGCGTGLYIFSGVDLLIEGCHFHNNCGPGLAVSPGPLNKAVIIHTRSSYNEGPGRPDGFILDSGEDIVIEKCIAENNAGSGLSCLTINTTVSASFIRDNGFYGIKCPGGGYKLINCIIDSNGMAGIFLQGGQCELFNNLTVFCGHKGDYGLVAASGSDSSPARISLVNNIFAYNYGGVHFDSSILLEKEDHNIYWSREDAEISTGNRRYSRNEINEQTWFKETGKGGRSFCRDPLFVDPSCRDFRLAKNSPAIDRGTIEGAPGSDINGNVRPQGGGFDIGPYESAEGSLVPPAARIIHAPVYSSDSSNSLKFRVRWEGFIEDGKVAGFNVQYKDGTGGSWQNWLPETTEREGVFCGAGGHTFYFRVRAKDSLGNWGKWSGDCCTVVPTDDRSPLIKYEGDWNFTSSGESYLNTLSCSASPGAAASFRFTGTEAAWISTLGPDRGQAFVYIDNMLQTTVDLYCDNYHYRRPVFSASLDGTPHTIRIVVAGTKNQQSSGYQVDVDGIAVKL